MISQATWLNGLMPSIIIWQFNVNPKNHFRKWNQPGFPETQKRVSRNTKKPSPEAPNKCWTRKDRFPKTQLGLKPKVGFQKHKERFLKSNDSVFSVCERYFYISLIIIFNGYWYYFVLITCIYCQLNSLLLMRLNLSLCDFCIGKTYYYPGVDPNQTYCLES